MDQEHKTIGALGTAISEANRAAGELAHELAALTESNQMLASLAREVAGRLGIKHDSLSAEATITAIGDLAEKFFREWKSAREVTDAVCEILGEDDPHHPVDVIAQDVMGQLQEARAAADRYRRANDYARAQIAEEIGGDVQSVIDGVLHLIGLRKNAVKTARYALARLGVDSTDNNNNNLDDLILRLESQAKVTKERAGRTTSVMVSMAKFAQAIAVAAGWPEEQPVEDPSELIESVAALRQRAEDAELNQLLRRAVSAELGLLEDAPASAVLNAVKHLIRTRLDGPHLYAEIKPVAGAAAQLLGLADEPTGPNPAARRTWAELRETGMLWLINRTLHLFGWAIVVVENETGEITGAHPVRTAWRGFPAESDERGFRRVTKWMVDHAEQLMRECELDDDPTDLVYTTPDVPQSAVGKWWKRTSPTGTDYGVGRLDIVRDGALLFNSGTPSAHEIDEDGWVLTRVHHPDEAARPTW